MTDPVLIRAARIVDGTGAPWFRADVLIEGGRIGAVGPDLAPGGARVLDAGDRYLAPGFIDAHCHDDLVALREPTRPEKVLQGVTTVVVGNCSFSLYPARPASAEALRLHFSGLLGETAPHEVFDGLAAYRAALDDDETVALLDDNPFGVDVGLRATVGDALAQVERALG